MARGSNWGLEGLAEGLVGQAGGLESLAGGLEDLVYGPEQEPEGLSGGEGPNWKARGPYYELDGLTRG